MPSELVRGSRNPLLIEELFCAVLRCLVDSASEPSPYPIIDVSYKANASSVPFWAPNPDTQRTLAILARTCRAFTRLALDFLWRRLDSLEPLLWCYTKRELILASILPLRTPSPLDWVVIRRYARRIQSVSVHRDLSPFFLECALFETNLFPNLTAVKWNTRPYISHLDTKLILPLLGARLVVLDLTAHGHDVAIPSLLRSLPSRCPAVTSARFSILAGGADMVLMDVFSQALSSFKCLKSLVVDSFVNDRVVLDILIMHQLQELTLTTQLHQLQDLSLLPSKIPLCNLRSLVLTIPHLRQLIMLLRPGQQSFCEIMLRFPRMEFAAAIRSLSVGLAMQSQKSTLRKLHIRHMQPYFDLQDPVMLSALVLSSHTFRPLSCHIHLRELILILPNPISLSNDNLIELARNWPLLQILELSYFLRLPEGANQTTFHGLLSLVAVCPDLYHVGLTLDGREVPTKTSGRLGSNTITTLRFPHSPINDQTRLVAHFLLTYFPSVESVTGPPGVVRVDRHASEWAEVEAYVADPNKLGTMRSFVNNNRGESVGLVMRL